MTRPKALALRRVLLDILGHARQPGAAPATETGEIAQQTESLVGPYGLHDFYLYYVLRFGFGPEENPAGTGRICREIPRRDAAALAEKLLPPLLHPAVQAQLPARRPEGRLRHALAARRRRMPSDACAAVWQAELEKLH